MKCLNLLAMGIILLLCSCDVAHRLYSNGQRSISIPTKCGEVQIYGETFLSDHVVLLLHGEFTIHLDSLKLIKHGKPVERVVFYRNNVRLADSLKLIHNEGEGKLRIFVNDVPALNYSHGVMKLMPSNFIECAGRQVIKDTIVFAGPSRMVSQ